MADFPFFKMAAVRYLGFLKLEISTSGQVRRHNMRHPAKFREDRSNRSGDIAEIFDFQDGGHSPEYISLPRIKLAALNFARRFIGVLGRESPILGNFAPPEAQNRTNRSLA